MSGAFSPLFEAMLYRDRDAIASGIVAALADGGVDALFKDLIRFAVLAFAPSEHGKAALLAVVAGSEIANALDDSATLVRHCAEYQADTRTPWSEPPIGDPPALEASQRDDFQEIEEAIIHGDRLRGERWLAANLERNDLAERFFSAAIAASGESLLTIPVAVALWKIASSVPDHVRFSILRNAVNDWTQHPHEMRKSATSELLWSDELKRLSVDVARRGGSLLELQRLIALGSLHELEEAAGGEVARGAASAIMAEREEETSAEMVSAAEPPPPLYTLARDYATYLILYRMRPQLAGAAGVDAANAILNAAWSEMQKENFEAWTMA
jgi:hypothetical protein